MRIAKKVLAIVLAIVMVVGSFVIATSAADDKKIYLSLKAQVMAGTGASQSEALDLDNKVPSTIRASAFSKQTTDINTYKSNKGSIAYQGSDAVITVNPGDMVWITTNLKSVGGVYPDAIQGQVFYDTTVFTSVAALVTNAYVWNANNELYKHSNSTLSGGVIYGRATQDFRDEYTPADFDAAKDKQYNQYTWFSAVDPGAVMANEEFPEMVAAQNSDLVTFPVYVRTDAPAGATAKIFTYNYAKLSGTYLPASDYSAEFDMGDIYETPIGYGPEMFDLSGAVLTFKVAGGEAELDYSGLEAQIADYEGRDADAYTEGTWADATAAYNTAKALVNAAESQDDIDAAATALKNALAALEAKPVLDYTGINNAIAAVPALDSYTTTTASAVTTAKANAESVKASATTQGELDAAATALNNAVAALEAKANFANLDAALNEAAATTNIGYTAESWAEFEAAVAAGQGFDRDETGVSSQAAVNAAANRIFDAIDGLEKEVVLNYAAWNAAVAKVPASTDGYTPASVAAYNAAKTEAEVAYAAAVAAKDQAALDEAAAALEAAIAMLAEAANKAALQAAIADAPEYAADMYSNWAAYADALNVANNVNNDANATQAEVDAAKDALVNAKAALTIAAADYSAVEAAKAKIPADLSVYTEETGRTVANAVDAVVYGKLKTEQALVDEMAQAIENAVANLEKLANYAAVEEAIAAAKAVNADLYVSMADVDAAIEAVEYGLGETKQAEVDAMAAAINNAIAALEEKAADYSAVEAAKKDAAAVNRDLYTAASLDNLDAAVAAVVEGKKISAQAEVDAMAEAIRDAIAALKFKPTEGAVEETLASTDVPYATNTFSIKVNGRPNKIRFVDTTDNSLTWTFSREKAREVGKIVSYNAAGEEVNDLSREIAYEIWTIDVALEAGTYYVNVKSNEGWEDLELSYIYEFKYSADDKAVNSIEATEADVTVGEFGEIVVKTGADVLKVQVISNGNVATFGNPVVADGVATFTVNAKVYLEGENVISFKIKTADGWEAISDTVTLNGVVAG